MQTTADAVNPSFNVESDTAVADQTLGLSEGDWQGFAESDDEADEDFVPEPPVSEEDEFESEEELEPAESQVQPPRRAKKTAKPSREQVMAARTGMGKRKKNTDLREAS